MRMEQVSVPNEARQRLRVPCSAEVEVQTGDRRTVMGRMRDVGLHSLYLFTDKKSDAFIIEGEYVKVKMTMQRDSSTLTIESEGRITRMDESGFVVQFSRSLRWWPVFIMFPGAREH